MRCQLSQSVVALGPPPAQESPPRTLQSPPRTPTRRGHELHQLILYMHAMMMQHLAFGNSNS